MNKIFTISKELYNHIMNDKFKSYNNALDVIFILLAVVGGGSNAYNLTSFGTLGATDIEFFTDL